MGTNYYLYEKAPCTECGRPYERKHIGKSSAGWCFSLHIEPENNTRDIDDWERLWDAPGAYIKSEYNEDIAIGEMRSIIMDRSWNKPRGRWPRYGYLDWHDFHTKNHSEPGPFGLLRHKIDGVHCVGHGCGTWDLIAGEFSERKVV